MGTTRHSQLLIAVVVLLGAFAVTPTRGPPPGALVNMPTRGPPVSASTDHGTLVFEDTFDKWNPDWTTRQVDYTSTATCAHAAVQCARTFSGQMILSVREQSPGKYLTGHVGTQGRQEFTYGYFETRAKFPVLRGTQAAFWLQTTEDYRPGQAEIDAVENFGRPAVWHNVYWRVAGQDAGEFLHVRHRTDLGLDGAQASWHTYGLDWLPDRYDFYVDGVLVNTITEGLSNRPKFLILSILIEDFEVKDFDPTRLSDYKARFKYVRVWQH